MQVNQGLRRSRLRYLHEGLFALNTAGAIVLLAFANSPRVYLPFAHLEVRINHLLHIRQIDYLRGHFQFWIPTLGLAFCFQLMLRIFSQRESTRWLIRNFAGAAAYFLLPLVWMCADPSRSLLFAHFCIGPIELGFVGIVFLLFVYRKPVIPIGIGVACAIAHYVFWCWLKGGGLGIPNFEVPGFFGPVGPFVAVSSAIVWFLVFHNSLTEGRNLQDARSQVNAGGMVQSK